MKAIMISIKPEWNEKILNREKTLEIRTTCPKEWNDYFIGKTTIKPEPITVYDYCTKNNKNYLNRKDYHFCYMEKRDVLGVTDKVRELFDNVNGFYERLNGQVVAEFTLNKVDLLVDYGSGIKYVDKDLYYLDVDYLRTNSCLTDEQIYFYLGLKKDSGYYNDGYVWHIDDLIIYDKPKELSEFGLKRTFQSWGYINEKNN